MTTFKSYFLFIINPKVLHSRELKQKGIYTLFQVFLITLALLFLVNLIFPESNELNQSSILPNLGELNKASIIFLLILIPLFEEVIFRLWLNLKRRSIIYSISLLLSSIVVLVLVTSIDIHTRYIFHVFYVASFVVSTPMYFVLNKIPIEWNFEVLKTRFNTFVLLSTLLFSCLHFLNYDFSQTDTFTLIKNFTTFLIYGYSFGFIRVSTGFAYGIALHIMLLFFPLLKYMI